MRSCSDGSFVLYKAAMLSSLLEGCCHGADVCLLDVSLGHQPAPLIFSLSSMTWRLAVARFNGCDQIDSTGRESSSFLFLPQAKRKHLPVRRTAATQPRSRKSGMVLLFFCYRRCPTAWSMSTTIRESPRHTIADCLLQMRLSYQ